MMQFAAFPTPYPDEIFYSILCRYHVRNANPGMVTTIKECWGYRDATKSLYLPTDLDAIVSRLPENTGITIEALIWKHTMYPYVRPVLSKKRADLLCNMLYGTERNCTAAYLEAGLSGRRLPLPKYLRFCPSCLTEDDETYGESYWHRIHQLPGVFICPKHGEYIRDSKYFTHMIFRYFFPADAQLCVGLPKAETFPARIEDRMVLFAEDSACMLNNGGAFGTLEDVTEQYRRILVSKGLRGDSEYAQTDYRTLSTAITEFYGKDFLEMLNANSKDPYHGWAAALTYTSAKPAMSEYLLMMRFLSGSPRAFLTPTEKFLPFGEGPWPCRNLLCSYNLKDCIEQIDIKIVHGLHKAVFTCPHCGFAYRRGKATPKERQYTGQIRMEDFGWLWKDSLRKYLSEQKLSVHKTAQLMRTCDDTVLIYGIQMGFLPESRMPNTQEQPKKGRIYKKLIPESVERHRDRWTQLVKDNPTLMRSELSRMNFQNYKWMLVNDYAWFDAHSPPAVKGNVDWAQRDEAYFNRIVQAVSDLVNTPGKPQWISRYIIGKMTALGNGIYHDLNRLPKTKQYVDSVTETKTEWRKRKIRWAINELEKEGKLISTYQIYLKSGMSTKTFETLREFIEDEIKKHIKSTQ